MEKSVLIEIQPNGLKMTTEKLMGGAFHKKIDEISDIIRFDEDIYETNEISEAKVNECVKLLTTYKKLCDAKGILKIFAYASPIFNNVRNSKIMFEDIFKKTGIAVISTTEEDEVKFIYNAMIGTVEVTKGVILYVNPQNTYVINFAKRSLISYHILPFGSNNLAYKFKCEETADAKKVMAEMVDYVKQQIKAENITFEMFEEVNFVGAGPTFLTLSKLVRKMTNYPLDMDNNFYVSNVNINKALALLEAQGFERSKRLANISNDRLDNIMSGIAIIKAFTEEKNVENYNIASRSVGDTIISTKIVKENSCDSTSNDLTEISLQNIKYYFPIEETNSDNVYALTFELYRQMSIIHKLTRKQVKSLRIASYLYDCGKRIAFENHSKHSKEIILNSNILNVSHKDLVVAGFGCQFQNLDNFSLAEWIRFKDIVNEEDLINARKIGTLINLASTLDCGKQNKIQEISCDLLGDIVIIKAKAIGDASYEINESNKMANTFKKVFKKAYQIM